MTEKRITAVTGQQVVTQLTEVRALTRAPVRDTILLDKYRVETVLGFGGAGLVIQAHHLGLNEKVAIKMLRDDVELGEENVARFVREAKAAVKLKSEHVARIRDVGVFPEGKPFMVMELLEGVDLGRLLHDQERIEPTLAVDLVLQACDAIAEAHSLGVVHRDIKPTNLFVARRRDGTPLLKVLDFGISKAPTGMEMSLTQTTSMLGTPAYMSPEQMRSARTVDARSDIWSLGTVLYELVEGVLPFEANNFAELCVLVATEEPRAMEVAPELEVVIRRCLTKSAEARYEDIGELAEALQPFASDPERAKREVTKIQRMLRRSREDQSSPAIPSEASGSYRPAARAASISPTINWSPRAHPVLVTFGAIVMIGLGVGAGLWFTRDERKPPAAAVPPNPAVAPTPTTGEPPRVEDRAGLPVAKPPQVADELPGAAGNAGSAATVRKPPKKPPARKPAKPPRPPTVVKPPPAPPEPPAPPPCDPFDARKRC